MSREEDSCAVMRYGLLFGLVPHFLQQQWSSPVFFMARFRLHPEPFYREWNQKKIWAIDFLAWKKCCICRDTLGPYFKAHRQRVPGRVVVGVCRSCVQSWLQYCGFFLTLSNISLEAERASAKISDPWNEAGNDLIECAYSVSARVKPGPCKQIYSTKRWLNHPHVCSPKSGLPKQTKDIAAVVHIPYSPDFKCDSLNCGLRRAEASRWVVFPEVWHAQTSQWASPSLPSLFPYSPVVTPSLTWLCQWLGRRWHERLFISQCHRKRCSLFCVCSLEHWGFTLV